MGSIIFELNHPMLYMPKYSLISVISCCICSNKVLILVCCIMNSECHSRNLLAVNSVCICLFMFNIVSFMLNMVSMIMSIFSLFSFISPLEMLVIVTVSSKNCIWSIWFIYNCFTSTLSESKSDWSAVPNKKLNSPPKGIRDLLNFLLLLFRVWSIRLEASSQVVLISVIVILISFRVILNSSVYLVSLY